MENARRYKKGEVIFKEGDSPQFIYIVQSGRLALNVERGGNKLEVAQLNTSQVFGEQAIFSNGKQAFSVETLQETKLIEVPVELLKGQFNQTPPGIKLLVKSLVDEIRTMRNSLKSIKMEAEKVPCPQIVIPRIFSLLNLVARHRGVPVADKPGECTIEWGVLKMYTSRLFAESPQRMRSLLDLLFKLKLIELKMATDEEGVEELAKIHIFDLQKIEDFADFYQYNLYKGVRAEMIYVDTLAIKVTKALVTLAKDTPPDRKGAVTLSYVELLEEVKRRFKMDLKNTHLDILEKKGLFVKRSTSENGGTSLSFDKVEFERTLFFWTVIHEIDKWNEKGVVELVDEEETKAQAGGQATCAQCSADLGADARFCPQCGCKRAA